MNNSDEEFFLRAPPPSTHLKKILQNYPEGPQIIKEALQNADDAGSRVFRVMVDLRRSVKGPASAAAAQSSGEALKRLAGPAIIFQNEAQFRKEDWYSIQRLFQSSKARDAAAIGRFGVGSRCYFHMTDSVWISSGSHTAFLDPDLLLDKSNGGGKYNHVKESRSNNNNRFTELQTIKRLALEYVEDLFGFQTGVHYPHTIIRCPLRSSKHAKTSTFAPYEYHASKALRMLSKFTQEAHRNLLFLKNVTGIEVWKWPELEDHPVCLYVTRVNGVRPLDLPPSEAPIMHISNLPKNANFYTPYCHRTCPLTCWLKSISPKSFEDRITELSQAVANQGASLPRPTVELEIVTFSTSEGTASAAGINNLASWRNEDVIDAIAVHQDTAEPFSRSFLPKLRSLSFCRPTNSAQEELEWHPHCLPLYMPDTSISTVTVSTFAVALEVASDPHLLRLIRQIASSEQSPMPIGGVAALLPAEHLQRRHMPPGADPDGVTFAESTEPIMVSRNVPLCGESSTSSLVDVLGNKATDDETEGTVCCYLPIPEVHSGLPVHLQGSFILMDNRRALWSGSDTDGQAGLWAEWNRRLVQRLAALYVLIITKIQAPAFELWPDVKKVEPFFRPLLLLFARKITGAPSLCIEKSPMSASELEPVQFTLNFYEPRNCIFLTNDNDSERVIRDNLIAATQLIACPRLRAWFSETANTQKDKAPWKAPLLHAICDWATHPSSTGVDFSKMARQELVTTIPRNVEEILVLAEEICRAKKDSGKSDEQFAFRAISFVALLHKVMIPAWVLVPERILQKLPLLPATMFVFVQLMAHQSPAKISQFAPSLSQLPFIPSLEGREKDGLVGCIHGCSENSFCSEGCSDTGLRKSCEGRLLNKVDSDDKGVESYQSSRLRSPASLYDPSMSGFRISSSHLPHSVFCSPAAIRVLRQWGLITNLTWSCLAKEMVVRAVEAVGGETTTCGIGV